MSIASKTANAIIEVANPTDTPELRISKPPKSQHDMEAEAMAIFGTINGTAELILWRGFVRGYKCGCLRMHKELDI